MKQLYDRKLCVLFARAKQQSLALLPKQHASSSPSRGCQPGERPSKSTCQSLRPGAAQDIRVASSSTRTRIRSATSRSVTRRRTSSVRPCPLPLPPCLPRAAPRGGRETRRRALLAAVRSHDANRRPTVILVDSGWCLAILGENRTARDAQAGAGGGGRVAANRKGAPEAAAPRRLCILPALSKRCAALRAGGARFGGGR